MRAQGSFTGQSVGISKAALREEVARSYERMGLLQSPALNAEALQEQTRREGVRPEDNLAS